MSFCIMLQSNHASSGWSSTKGPRYLIIGEAMTEFIIASTAVSRSMPPFSAISSPSEYEVICTKRLRLIAIFISRACPLSPIRRTIGPTSSMIGLTRSNASGSPPTMIDALPCSTVVGAPEIGASSILAPSASTSTASVREFAGEPVVMSMRAFPAVSPARMPSGPRVTASSAFVSVTIANTTSARSATSRGESARIIPSSTSHCALSGVRFQPRTVWPASSSRLATVPPIAPSPTNPSSATGASSLVDLREFPLDAQDVLRHQLSRPLGVFRLDRLGDQAVLRDRALRPAREIEAGPEHLRQPVADRLHQAKQEPVARRLRDHEVEADVGGDEPVGPCELDLHVVRRLVHLVQLVDRATGGGERRRLRLDHPPHLEELRTVDVLPRDDERQRLLERVAPGGDDERAAAAALDQAPRLEHPQRLAHRRPPDAVALSRLASGRECLPGLQRRAELRPEPFADLLVDLPPLDRGERLRHWSDSMTNRSRTYRPPVSLSVSQTYPCPSTKTSFVCGAACPGHGDGCQWSATRGAAGSSRS